MLHTKLIENGFVRGKQDDDEMMKWNASKLIIMTMNENFTRKSNPIELKTAYNVLSHAHAHNDNVPNEVNVNEWQQQRRNVEILDALFVK